MFATFNPGYTVPRRRVGTPVEQLQPLYACGKLDGHIGRLLHMLGTVYRWCVAVFISSLWNIPTPVNQVLDARIVQTCVKIDALCEQRWPPKQHPGTKSGHMLHLLCHQGPLGTVCLEQNSDHEFLWPGYHLHHDTTKHDNSGVVNKSTGEWNCALLFFSDDGRFCLYAND